MCLSRGVRSKNNFSYCYDSFFKMLDCDWMSTSGSLSLGGISGMDRCSVHIPEITTAHISMVWDLILCGLDHSSTVHLD